MLLAGWYIHTYREIQLQCSSGQEVVIVGVVTGQLEQQFGGKGKVGSDHLEQHQDVHQGEHDANVVRRQMPRHDSHQRFAVVGL